MFLETLKALVKIMAALEARPRPAPVCTGCGGQGARRRQVISAALPGSACSAKRGDSLARNNSCGFKNSGEGLERDEKVSSGELFSSYIVKIHMPGGQVWAERRNNTSVLNV